MTDYLNRLIKRANGQAPVIKPLVRPSYVTLPLINESVTEFEETVTFNEETNSPVSRMPTPVISPVKSPPVTGKNNIGETQESVRTSEVPEVIVMPDASLHSTSPANLSSTRSSPEKKITQKKTKAIISESDNPNPNVVANTPVKRKTQLRSKQDDGLGVEPVDRQKETVERVQTTSPDNRHITDDSPQHYNIEKILAPERTGISQPDIAEVRPLTRVISRQNSLQESNLPRGLETEEPADAIRQVHLVRRYKPEANLRQNERMTPGRVEEKGSSRQEASPAMNIRVTIGRVEIKAMQQPERQIQRTPAVPKGPAVPLDAYLEGRDEEGR